MTANIPTATNRAATTAQVITRFLLKILLPKLEGASTAAERNPGRATFDPSNSVLASSCERSILVRSVGSATAGSGDVTVLICPSALECTSPRASAPVRPSPVLSSLAPGGAADMENEEASDSVTNSFPDRIGDSEGFELS